MANEFDEVVSYVGDVPGTLSLTVKDGSRTHLEIAAFSGIPDRISLQITVGNGAYLDAAFADFAPNSTHVDVSVRLLGESSEAVFRSAVLSSKKSKKEYLINAYHEAGGSKALVSSYGISRDEASLLFSGVSEIKKGFRGCSTRQEAKIIVFDKKSSGSASPMLKIGDNDVSASHAAVVGRLNDDHIYYLMSRGVSEDEAKRLITLGYLRPIESGFLKEGAREKIEQAIEGGI